MKDRLTRAQHERQMRSRKTTRKANQDCACNWCHDIPRHSSDMILNGVSKLKK